MHIEEFEVDEVWEAESDDKKSLLYDHHDDRNWDTKRVLVGAGARVLFYPTLFYNVFRNKFQSEFRWWDRIGQFVLLGAVPFPSDVLRLKELGVHGVVTLNEPYETLVPTSLYHAHGIYHLVLPTRDYLFAPSMIDISQAVDFIHRNACRGWTTYVHCKAGRGRSTTIVLCYLVQHKQMTPEEAYSYVRSIRPRVQLAASQWQAVKDYYDLKVKGCHSGPGNELVVRSSRLLPVGNLFKFDDCSVVVVTKSDLEDYASSHPSVEGTQILADLNVIYKVRVAGHAALARLSCLWLRCHTQQKIAEDQLLRKHSCTIRADQTSDNLTVDIHVY
ncbi:phosphatidylglycerophosphate phosphatase PTPMT2-like isoform X1 [Amaranthus tricolor]|uniref:phosphatidylglycerophosphate phosphatase PTPMT2-like isoform X1 n=1 Tax=Amaranthus tricolor TaxID=29722 RepID=UPI0025847D75|nr:phosphatidylglycerophosphate phosphatase PTPMT2-like isoform X1 [Amaranthus tricolor]